MEGGSMEVDSDMKVQVSFSKSILDVLFLKNPTLSIKCF